MTTLPHVLLVDDDPDALLLLEKVLERDHQLTKASDGDEAWTSLRAMPRSPDLVICDLSMPRVPGDELVRRMREDPRYVTVPVILLTGNDSDEARLGVLEAGVSDYVLKPFPPSELRLRVRNILRDNELLREVQQAREEAEEANRQLREVNAELDRFAAAAAHDIQAPLANIAGYAHLLAEGIVSDVDKQRQLLGSIAENAGRAIVLVRELLNHARTVASSDEVDVIDLTPIISSVAKHLATAIDESNAHLLVEGTLGLVIGRRVAIESLLLNIVSNAIKYSHADRSPIVEIRTQPASKPGYVEVIVSDNGRGIPAADRERVFGLGSRGDNPESGTGIGLATVRAVVARHGGTISLHDSGPPGGLTVRFTLPAA